jgi:hypothetical protein
VNRGREQVSESDFASSTYHALLDRLVRLGKQRGVWPSFDAFASSIGISARVLQDYRNGKNPPPPSRHQKMKAKLAECPACGVELLNALDRAYERVEIDRSDESSHRATKHLFLGQDETRSESANPAFVNAWLEAPDQRGERDGVLRSGFWVSFRRDPRGEFRLNAAELRVSLPRGAAISQQLGRTVAEPCEDGAEIKLQGHSPTNLAWSINPRAPNATLEDHNVETGDRDLFAVSGVAAGQEIESLLVAYPKKFEPVGPHPAAPNQPDLPLEKEKIIQALQLKRNLQRRASDGAIVLVMLVDVVREAPE